MSAGLAERLGLAPTARAVILNADDFGMCHAANTAITRLLGDGAIDSATVMVPCAWAPEALAFAASRPDLDVGVHLVLTSEWTRYRWRPLTAGATLVDEAGFFPADVRAVEEGASEADVAAELGAQLQAALDAGVDVTHLDNHMGSVYGLLTGRDFLGPVLGLAARHGLPFRLPRTMEGADGDPALQATLTEAAAAADALGVEIVDRLWTHPFDAAPGETYEQVRDGFIALLRAVPPGVTEIYLHPMVDDDELRAAVDFGAEKRGHELRLLSDPAVQRAIADEGLVRIGWRDLRDQQRKHRA